MGLPLLSVTTAETCHVQTFLYGKESVRSSIPHRRKRRGAVLLLFFADAASFFSCSDAAVIIFFNLRFPSLFNFSV